MRASPNPGEQTERPPDPPSPHPPDPAPRTRGPRSRRRTRTSADRGVALVSHPRSRSGRKPAGAGRVPCPPRPGRLRRPPLEVRTYRESNATVRRNQSQVGSPFSLRRLGRADVDCSASMELTLRIAEQQDKLAGQADNVRVHSSISEGSNTGESWGRRRALPPGARGCKGFTRRRPDA